MTIEGLNMEELNPIQQAIAEEGGTQCGFCTPGFVVSLAGFCLSEKEPSSANAIECINGNICRCTGYKSLERAAGKLALLIQGKVNGVSAIDFVTQNRILPPYFAQIPERLIKLSSDCRPSSENTLVHPTAESSPSFLAGGTDLYVQQHETLAERNLNFLASRPELQGIYQAENRCVVGASATVTDLIESSLFQEYFPGIFRFIKLVSSTPIRNMATIAGNFVNASPIGDLTIFFLALDATIKLTDGKGTRELPLRQLYKGYKVLDKRPEEYIEKIWFELPGENTLFNFEKVSKRTHLDIASVNTALSITTKENRIVSASLSAGGVGPVPMFLTGTSQFLTGSILSEETIGKAIDIMQKEISPISDARGSEAYKRLLLNQLVKSHFISLFTFVQADKLFELTT